MSRFDVPTLADRAGVEPGFVGKTVDLGILTPDADALFSTGDVRRVKLIDTLVRSGVPLESLSTAVGDGTLSLGFLDDPAYDRLAPLGDLTFATLSEETSLPLDLLAVIREATGSVPARPEDRVREDELLVVPFLRFGIEIGVSPRGLERLLRVHGDSLRRMAESENDWWFAELLPAVGSDNNSADKLDAATKLPPSVFDWSDQAVLAIYHAQQAHVWTKSMIEMVEVALERAGLHSRSEKVPAIGFLDISGFTRLTDQRGDAAGADLAEQVSTMVQRIALRHGGDQVKRLGDGVMLHYTDPSSGVLAALEMVGGVAAVSMHPAHVGLHAGPVLFQDGDYYGRTVNVAARIADYARPGEVLVSQEVVDASDLEEVSYTELGPVELKGVAEPARLWVARRR